MGYPLQAWYDDLAPEDFYLREDMPEVDYYEEIILDECLYEYS